jgi:hypothetical protein
MPPLHLPLLLLLTLSLTHTLARPESLNHTFSPPLPLLGTHLFQLGSNFCDRPRVRQFFLQHRQAFSRVYRNRPDQVNLYGVRLNHAFAVYMVARVLGPRAVLESGVNAGQTTYFFRQGCSASESESVRESASASSAAGDTGSASTPSLTYSLTPPSSTPPSPALIVSIDPMAESNEAQEKRWIDSTNNVYLTGEKFQDITAVDWKSFKGVDVDTTLVFIDDHQKTFPRMQALHKQGFTHFMIEDNYAFGYGATKIEKGHSPKTILLGRHGNMNKAIWLKENMETYHEIPPIFYGGNVLSDRKKYNKELGIHLLQGNFSFLPIYAEPLFRTDKSDENLKLAQEFRDLLGNDFVKNYDDYMCYNHIAYIKMKKYVEP